MKRFTSKLAIAAALLSVFALPMFADEGPAGILGQRPGIALRRVIRCLKILDLSSTQKSEIQTILQEARTEIQPLRQAVKADRQKLESDIASGADKAVIGQDVLDLKADATKLHDQISSVRDQVLSKLTVDQKAKLTGCLEAPGANLSPTP